MLGCLVFTMCFAIHPFMDSGQLAIVNGDYQFPSEKQISEEMKELIRWLLTPDPRERPEISSILDCLQKWGSPLSKIKLPPTAIEVKSR